MKASTAAQLSKGRALARCGRCGNTIAQVNGSQPSLVGDVTPMSAREVVTLSGWIDGGDGIWTPSTHAQARYDRDRRRATSNPETPQQSVDDARRRINTGKSLSLRRTIVPPMRVQRRDGDTGPIVQDALAPRQLPRRAFRAHQLPILLRCNRCQSINECGITLLN